MLYVSQKLRSVFIGLSASLLVLSPVLADDTEIYVGGNQGVNDVPPNILFVVDTSGSMASIVVTQANYDPATTYAGCFDASRVYFKTNTDTPSCGTNNYFNLSALKCQTALDQFATTGFLTDRFAQYRSNPIIWRNINQNNKTARVECEDDRGSHGGGGAATYAANNGPWSTDENDEINWSAQTAYTVSSGNYANWRESPGTVRRQRIEIVKESIQNLVESMDSTVNVGLMRYDRYSSGGMIVTAMDDLNAVEDDFIHELYRMYPRGGTPLARSLYEAARYFKGLSPAYGASSFARSYNITQAQSPYQGAYGANPFGNGEGYYTYSGISVPDVSLNSVPESLTGGVYNSPIDFECQKNFVVFITDGEPSASDNLSSGQRSAIGATSCNKLYDSNDGGTDPDMLHCLPRIAEAMATIDQNTTLAGDQTVSTYTIGFATDQVLLEDTARLGNGEYDTADDSASLATVFNNIIVDILSVSSTFSSPAVSVNAFNRTAHRDDLYFTLFKPNVGPHWDGNFKRYQLAFRADGSPKIIDFNLAEAIDNSTGFFKENALSYWTTNEYAPDGKEAAIGGAANQLPNASPSRKVYTDIDGVLITSSANRVTESNSGLNNTVLGIGSADSTYRANLLKWARGVDINDDDDDGSITDGRVIMGDPLHAQPALIQYGGPDDNPEIIAYVATNDGYLHAIDTREASGVEKFAYIPKELLPNLNTLYDNSNSNPKQYGLDGSVVAWVNDTDRDGVIEAGDGDSVYIYFGMRRGGNNIYAMDVTDYNNPVMLWSSPILGGTGSFTELGETWSRPVLRKVRVNGTITQVLVFSGGYNTNQDGASARSADANGRAVYMINAETGALIWSASHTSNAAADIQLAEMQYSMPADVSAIDVNADGFLDVIYAVDMGGQVFRFDFPESETNNATGGRIAELATNALVNTRRFYYPPDVAIIKNKDRIPALALVINSGYRAHPNNLDTQDRIYMLKDTFPIPGVTPTYSTVTDSDLYNATDNLIGADGDATENVDAQSELNTSDGWYINLESTGEKGLGKPFIFENTVFVSSFLPSSGSVSACAPSEGGSVLYIMKLIDAQPTFANGAIVDDSSSLSKDSRRIDLKQSGIAGDPKLIMQPGHDDTLCVGTECIGVSNLGQLKSEYWFEQ